MAGGGGSGLVAMGTQPMAAARANGSHAATEAMFGAIVKQALSREKKHQKSPSLFLSFKKKVTSFASASPTPAPPPPKSHFHCSNPMVQHSFFPQLKNPPPDLYFFTQAARYYSFPPSIAGESLPSSSSLALCVRPYSSSHERKRCVRLLLLFLCFLRYLLPPPPPPVSPGAALRLKLLPPSSFFFEPCVS